MSKLKRKEYKKLLKSIAKEWEKSGLLSGDLSDVAGGGPRIGEHIWPVVEGHKNAASRYRRRYGFDDPKPSVYGPNVPGRTSDPLSKFDDHSYGEELNHWYKKRGDDFIH